MAEQTTLNPFFYVQRVLLQMHSSGVFSQGLPIAIDDIAKAVVSISAISEIRFRLVDVESNVALGVFQRLTEESKSGSRDVAEIIVSSRLDDAWKRFVACKEICQVFLSDISQSRSADPGEIAAYLAGLLDQSVYKPFSPALQSDQFATVCAMELLCPFFIRERFYSEFERKQRTITSVASLFRIPDQIAQIIFSSSYHENSLRAIAAEKSLDFRLDPRSRSLSNDLQLMFQRNVETAISENEHLKASRSLADDN